LKFPLLLIPTLAAAGTLAACGASSKDSSGSAAAKPAASSPSNVVSVTARDFGFMPARLTAKAGKVTIRLRNDGKDPHEFIVLRTHDAPSKLPVHSGRVSEKDSVGEVSETPAGAVKTATLTLKRGTYVIACNVPGHYKMGMHGTLKVV
jgi:uncharacterized cupredoxin-like copper-binding protein